MTREQQITKVGPKNPPFLSHKEAATLTGAYQNSTADHFYKYLFSLLGWLLRLSEKYHSH